MALSAATQDLLVQAARGSYDRSAMDVIDHVLYDENNFQAATARTNTSYFTVAIGGTYFGGVKTQAETNMQLQGQLPSNQHFVASELSIALKAMHTGGGTNVNTINSAFVNLVQGSQFSLKLAGREFDTQVPGSVFLPPVFLTGISSAANPMSPIGMHTSSGWMTLKLNVIIEGGAAFSVQQITQSASATLTTLLNTASDVLATQNAALEFRLKGTLIRFK